MSHAIFIMNTAEENLLNTEEVTFKAINISIIFHIKGLKTTTRGRFEILIIICSVCYE